MTNGKTPPAAAVCIPRRPPASRVDRAKTAIETNSANHPTSGQMAQVAAMTGGNVTPEHIAVMTTKYWGAGGVDLGVGFLDTPPKDLRAKILSHMNAWGNGANVRFRESGISPEVRIARALTGHWSYLGTDIKTITDATKPTMNLQAFTMNTADSEFYRVVRHETGHTLGFPHEHMRKELIALIDRKKAIAFYMKDQGWSEDEVIHQVLTSLDEATLKTSGNADAQSIMCYQIPAELTTNGKPILGGTDIDEIDRNFAKALYPPKASAPPKTTSEAAPEGEQDRARQNSHRHEPDVIELRADEGLRVLLTRPVEKATLERVLALFG